MRLSILLPVITPKWLFTLLVLLCISSGCVQKQTAISAELKTYHSGTLYISSPKNTPHRIYVDAPGAAHLAEDLNAILENGPFQLVDSPSKAGYILHVTILKEGKVAAPAIVASINAGYGNKLTFTGQDKYGILADALLVARRIPKSPKPSRRKLENISSRNALGSAQMRLAVVANPADANHDRLVRALAQELAAHIRH